jgi:hypothetical protein
MIWFDFPDPKSRKVNGIREQQTLRGNGRSEKLWEWSHDQLARG